MNFFRIKDRRVALWKALALAVAVWLSAVPPVFAATVRPALAAGYSHMLALRSDGTVWSWGDNTSNQLGDATVKLRTVPGQVAGLAGAVAVSAGDIHNLVLLANGEVWAWGNNTYGQLGDGTQTTHDAPAKVQGLSDVIAIAAGGFSNLALKRDGTVWAWGFNIYGQLGLGTTSDVAVPTQITGLADVVGIAACRSYSGCGAALKRDGSVWTWGNNGSGQLGDGTRTNRSQPARIAIANVTRLSVGSEFLFAELSDGSVWAWGRNDLGELGDGTTANRLVPAPVAALQGYRQLAGGLYHALGVAPDGSVRAWGQNVAGEVGDGSKTQRNTPVAVVGAPANPAAMLGGQWFSAALGADGALWTWGENSSGQLGRGMTGAVRPFAQKISALNVATVAAGHTHSLGLSSDGTIWAWGGNAYGQLGSGNTTSSATPAALAGLKAVAVAACEAHSLALTGAGEVYAWGANSSGQLGDGTTTQRNTPTVVPGIGGIIAIGCGDAHSVALGQDGRVWTWGQNWFAQLGNGVPSSAGSLVPLPVAGLANIRAIAAGGQFTLALADGGTVYAWGRNDSGQLGDGSNTARATPVVALNGATRIVAGFAHAFASGADGNWYGWGKNDSGQLGTGDTGSRSTPLLMNYPLQFAGLSASGGEGSAAHVSWNWGQTLGVTAGGVVWGWGSNGSGLLGGADTSNRTSPRLISGVSGIRQAVVGKNHVLAVATNGEVWSWGDSSDGKLGQTVDLTKAGMALNSDYTTPFNLGGGFTAFATVSGPSTAPTISASLSVAAADRGKTGRIYVAYQLPSGILYFLAPSGWLQYDGQRLPYIFETVLGDHSGVLWPGISMMGMSGTVFYVGYGLSESDLLDNHKYSAIYTVPGL
ncbi:MAG: hypothetical protein KGZ83_18415 [Sulfuricella sp.]|nr:hypothetical protein [Sulfuricella sp.]